MFVYHRFGESRYPSTNISLATFAAQLDYLQRQKIPVLSLLEVAEHLRSGESLPERYVVLTVDDGYSSFLSGAMPLLRRYRFPVTLFVSSRSVGARGYLDWQQLLDLKREGVIIGNHSHSHPHLLNLMLKQGDAAVRDELRHSQELFKTHLGEAPLLFAYPFGESVPKLSQLVADQGFIAAAVQHSGVVYERSELMALPRFAMGGVYATLEGFVEKSRMHALPVSVKTPDTGLLGDKNPPVLVLQLAQGAKFKLSDLNCFVAGERRCSVRKSARDAESFEVVADHPLSGRRNRYTLTAGDAEGRWYWFSWLWIDPGAHE